jgi:hypothetical protein
MSETFALYFECGTRDKESGYSGGKITTLLRKYPYH